MVLVISSQVRNFLRPFVLQQDDADLADWVLVKKLFDEQLQHFQRVEEPRRLEIWNGHRFGTVEHDVEVSHHAEP